MSGKINGANHLPTFPPILPPPERPITNPASQQGAEPVKVKGKARTGGSGSQKIGTHDPQIDVGLNRQLPDAVEQKPQQKGFERQDSFRADEVQKGALQQQTIGQAPRQKQSRVVRELTTARQRHGFSQGEDVSGSKNPSTARNVQRHGNSPVNSLQQRASTRSYQGMSSLDDTIRTRNPLQGGLHVASEVTQQTTAPAIDALSGLLQDQSTDPVSQMNAANSLGQLKQPEASPALLEAAYGDNRWEVRDAAMQALSQFPEQAAHYVNQHFDTLSPKAQSAALDHLSRTPNESAVQTFLAATDSPEAEIRHKGLKKLESAVMFERTSGQAVFGPGGALRQQVVNTAARLSRDADQAVSSKAADLLYLL